MNTVEGKPGHGLTSAEGTRERRGGLGQARGPGKGCYLIVRRVLSPGAWASTCRENAQSLYSGGPGLQDRVTLATLW